MNALKYYIHLLLHSKLFPLVFFSCIALFINILNSTSLCEANNDNVIKNEIVKEEGDTTIALILFSISILFSIYALPHILDGTLIDRIVDIINEKPYEEVYKPATTQEVLDWADEWLKKELGLEGKTDKEIHAILFSNK